MVLSKHRRLAAIFIYLLPIVVTIGMNRTTDGFLICTGIMNIILGTAMLVKPDFMGYKKGMSNKNTALLVILSGIFVLYLLRG